MKEVTQIITCEITNIAKVNGDALPATEEIKHMIAKYLKEVLDADDVNVLESKVFVREVEDHE